MSVNAREETFEHIELFSKPALFTSSRINRATVPEGFKRRRISAEIHSLRSSRLSRAGTSSPRVPPMLSKGVRTR